MKLRQIEPSDEQLPYKRSQPTMFCCRHQREYGLLDGCPACEQYEEGETEYQRGYETGYEDGQEDCL